MRKPGAAVRGVATHRVRLPAHASDPTPVCAPAIAIDDEPLVADRSDWVPICVEGFELVLA
jgi:hypothetical protein